ncbi:hypothetical protein [Streptomyces sp. NPDC051569]|uniref:hypothetical protein n=1 Tax=Streptomyces sp. NPDC051569 TaxID=3365661 RepID=UPI0037B229F0
MTTWLAGMTITAQRLADGLDTITTTTGLVASTGFSVTDFRGTRLGRSVVLDMYIARTGAALTATTGNIVDTACCTVPVGWRPTNGTINGNFDDGTASGAFVVGGDGLCTLRTASSDIVTGRNLRMHISFITT